MFPEERKREILLTLQAVGKVKNLELAKALGVSEPTIRKDIADLDQEGLLIRTHGGAIPVETSALERGFSQKKSEGHAQKQAIAQVAMTLVRPGSTILLDSGTTTLEIAKQLGDFPVTVVTNSLDIAQSLEVKQLVEVIVLGGTMRWHTRALVGPLTHMLLSRLACDLAFIGTNAIGNNGFSTPNVVEAETKMHMIQAAKRSFIVADASKIGERSFVQFADFTGVSGLITDGPVPEDFTEKCKALDFDVLSQENKDVIP